MLLNHAGQKGEWCVLFFIIFLFLVFTCMSILESAYEYRRCYAPCMLLVPHCIESCGVHIMVIESCYYY